LPPQRGQGARRILLRDGPDEGRDARLFRSATVAPGSAAAAESVGTGDAAQLLGIWLGTGHPRLPDDRVMISTKHDLFRNPASPCRDHAEHDVVSMPRRGSPAIVIGACGAPCPKNAMS